MYCFYSFTQATFLIGTWLVDVFILVILFLIIASCSSSGTSALSGINPEGGYVKIPIGSYVSNSESNELRYDAILLITFQIYSLHLELWLLTSYLVSSSVSWCLKCSSSKTEVNLLIKALFAFSSHSEAMAAGKNCRYNSFSGWKLSSKS